MKARLCWRAKLTGQEGHGSWLPYRVAQAWHKEAGTKWGHVIDHWLEECHPGRERE